MTKMAKIDMGIMENVSLTIHQYSSECNKKPPMINIPTNFLLIEEKIKSNGMSRFKIISIDGI